MVRIYSPTARRMTLWLAIGCSPACTSWRTRAEPLPIVLARHPPIIRLTLGDGSQVELKHPAMVADTASGSVARETWTSANSPGGVGRTVPVRHEDLVPRSIPLTDIRQVAVSRFSIGRTLKLTLGPVFLVWLGLGIGVAATW